MLLRFLCWLGFHKRSKSRAHYHDNELVSVCRRCRAPMKKEGGKWSVASQS